MGFRDFLHMVERLREILRLDLWRMFQARDPDNTGYLSLAEVAPILTELGVNPKTKDEQYEIRAILDDVDEDGSGEVDFEEFVTLYGMVTSKIHGMQQEAELQVARKHGFNEVQLRHFRDAFEAMDIDGSGGLDIKEVRGALEKLRRNIRAEEMWELFESLGVDPLNGVIEFPSFLKMMKMMDTGASIFSGFKQNEQKEEEKASTPPGFRLPLGGDHSGFEIDHSIGTDRLGNRQTVTAGRGPISAKPGAALAFKDQEDPTKGKKNFLAAVNPDQLVSLQAKPSHK